ncbi:MAG: type I-E CRISPR-associated protein Cse2/CasB [Anaerolineae bacterium]|nr:type I-E CRISPR-associated protein Cse2/CasB [Anaerolineae bacterium]
MHNHLKPEQYYFIKYLTSLDNEQNRDVLAVMRRGLTGQPVEDLNLYRFVAKRVPDFDRGVKCEAVYYLIAALYAYHPLQTDKGNFGNHMSLAASKRNDQEAAERRFTVLLSTRMSEVAIHLRQAIAILKQQEIPVNWECLFADLLIWDHPQKIVQRAWANGFWTYELPSEAGENRSSETKA